MGSINSAPKHRTAKQIVTPKGAASKTDVTSNLWVSDPGRFADKTEGNKIRAFTTGEAYFADLVTEINKAKSQIMMAGWQINWDVLLAPGVRLYDALFNAAQNNKALKIYVMPWHQHQPLQTYSQQTLAALQVINQKLGREVVHGHLCTTYATENANDYAHHQKQVVIDGTIAYVGGMDVCYGRFCDEHYTLKANAKGREGLNRYNGCVAAVGVMPGSICADPDLLSGPLDNLSPSALLAAQGVVTPGRDLPSNAQATADLIQHGGWQPKYKPGSTLDVLANANAMAADDIEPTTLDDARQPRMPWQDIHCRIEGPAAADLMRNFVSRWNTVASGKDRLPPAPDAKQVKACGNAHIQVLRSAPAHHCQKEYDALASKAGVPKPAGTQHDVLTAMLTLIEKSRRFIYIENQYFVSDFGNEAPRDARLSPAAQFIDKYPDGKSQNDSARILARLDSHSKRYAISPDVLKPPSNGVVKALLDRIWQSARSNSPFHVYITMPVHPEGLLTDATIATQIYWTMQTISFGSHSLLNGVRRIIKARQLLHSKDKNYERVLHEGNNEYEDVDLSLCEEFVTLLNLRNWAKLGDRYVSEQIYVHSKTMVVDDLYALIGSANLNDRSLLGERDSELAVLVMDGDTLRADVNGAGSNRVVRKFAHQLRIDIWKKLFGFTDGKRPATELAKAIEQPGSADSWKAIQKRAAQNAAAFEAAFPWTPRNWFINSQARKTESSILPTWDNGLPAPSGASWGGVGRLSKLMPFQPEFWNHPQQDAGVEKIEQVRGFIAALPILWTNKENNRFEFPIDLVAENEESNPNSSRDSTAQGNKINPTTT